MQKTLFVFVLMLSATVCIAFLEPFTSLESIRLGQVLTLLVTIGFNVFSATLVMKSRVRNWKSISLLILFSVAYLYLLITRIIYIPDLSEHFLPVYLGLISLLLLTAGIYVFKNKESVFDLLKDTK